MLGTRLATLDDLAGAARRPSALAPAVERRLRAEVAGEVERFAEWLRTRRGADAVALLRGEADAIRERHVRRLRQRASLTDAQLAEVDASAAAIVAELLHGPSVRLRNGDADAAVVRRLFGIEL
jgi:glutamyl-tRNA reductase